MEQEYILLIYKFIKLK